MGRALKIIQPIFSKVMRISGGLVLTRVGLLGKREHWGGSVLSYSFLLYLHIYGQSPGGGKEVLLRTSRCTASH